MYRVPPAERVITLLGPNENVEFTTQFADEFIVASPEYGLTVPPEVTDQEPKFALKPRLIVFEYGRPPTLKLRVPGPTGSADDW